MRIWWGRRRGRTACRSSGSLQHQADHSGSLLWSPCTWKKGDKFISMWNSIKKLVKRYYLNVWCFYGAMKSVLLSTVGNHSLLNLSASHALRWIKNDLTHSILQFKYSRMYPKAVRLIICCILTCLTDKRIKLLHTKKVKNKNESKERKSLINLALLE